jgi:hypothetical protein
MKSRRLSWNEHVFKMWEIMHTEYWEGHEGYKRITLKCIVERQFTGMGGRWN